MLSWKSIRIVCIVLLLLPIVHLAYLVSRDAMAILDPSPTVWTDELHAYANNDNVSHLPESPVVVVGGRRVKLWSDLPDMLADHPVLMRGLGDAIIEDITYHYTALIGFYRPSAVVVMPGHSEFHIRDSKSAEQLVTAIQELEALDASHGITRHFYVFTPLKTVLYPGDNTEIETASRLLMEWATQNERVTVLDGNPLLADSTGKPKAGYFLSDGVNLNDAGYLRLAMLLQVQMAANNEPAPETGAES